MHKSIIFVLTLCFFPFDCFAQNNEAIYQAGFKIISLTDSTRVYKPNSSQADRLHYRPLEVDVWYPSEISSSQKMLFRDFLESFEERSNQYQDENDYTGIAVQLAQSFTIGLGLDPDKADSLLNYETHSYQNIEPAAGKFPLILYLAGFNGMGFENITTLEKLAQQGYIVISISSIGRYPGDMTNNKLDMLEQVYDAEYTLSVLQDHTNLNIDFEKIGVIGTSWGGMSAAVLMDRNPTIDTMVSLDGTETYYFGETEIDDDYLNEIYNSDLIHPENTTAAYLYLESGNKLDGFTPTSEYHYFKKISSEKYYVQFLDSQHEDFLSIPFLLNVPGRSADIYNTISESTLRFFDTYLKNEGKFDSFYNELTSREDITEQPFTY